MVSVDEAFKKFGCKQEDRRWKQQMGRGVGGGCERPECVMSQSEVVTDAAKFMKRREGREISTQR